MKNNFFRKVLALFLSGTMLAAVGCKDYDDDIDSINKRVDALEGEITKLNKVAERFEAVETVYNQLKDFKPSDYVKNSDLTTKLNDAKTAWLQEVANTYLTKNGLENALTALDFSFANAETIAAMKSALDTYFAKPGAEMTEEQKKQVEEYLAGVLAAGQKTLGGAMSKYLESYVPQSELENYLKNADLDEKLLKELTENSAAYKTAIESYVSTYMAETYKGEDKLVTSKELQEAQTTMNNSLSDIKTTLAALRVDVDALIRAIQSIEFVPEYDDGKATIEYARIGSDLFYNDIEMTFLVRPADQAAKIVDLSGTESVSLLVQTVKTRAASEAPAPALKNVKIVAGKAAGSIVVTATPENFEDISCDKSYSVALEISKAPTKEGGADGITRTTSFTNLKASATMYLEYALRNTEDAEAAVIVPSASTRIEKEIAFNDQKGVQPFGEFEAVYYDTDNQKVYTAKELNELGYASIAAPVFKSIAYKAFAADGTEITAETPDVTNPFVLSDEESAALLVKMAATAKKEDMGKYLTTTCVFSYGEGEEREMSVEGLLTVIGTKSRIVVPDAELVWKFADAAAYEQGIAVESAIEVEQGKEFAPGYPTLKDLLAASATSVELVAYESTDAEKTPIANAVTKLESKNGADNTAVITFDKDIAWNKSYTVVATYTFDEITVVLTAQKITLTGLPAELALTVPAADIEIARTGNTVGKSVSIDALYNDNKTVFEKYFKNIVEFSTFLDGASATAKNTTDVKAGEGEDATDMALNNATALRFTFETNAVESGKPQMYFIPSVFDTDAVKAGQKIFYRYEFEAVTGTQTLKAKISYDWTLVLPTLALNYDLTITSGDVTLKAEYAGDNQVYTLTAELYKYLTARIGEEDILAGDFGTNGLSLRFSKPAEGSASGIDEATGALTYKAQGDETYTAELYYHGIASGAKKALKVKQPQSVFKAPTVKEYTLVREAGGMSSIAINSDMLQLKNYEDLEMIIDKTSDGTAIFGAVKEHAGKSAYAMYGATVTFGTPTLKLENGSPVVGYTAKFDQTAKYLLNITHSEEALGQPQIVEIPVTVKCPYQKDMTATVRIKLVQSK